MKKILLFAMVAIGSCNLYAQGHLSGDLMMNVNFFDRDTTINASNNPLYDNYLSGGEAWLTMRYNNKGFTAFARVDAFHNSNLLNLTSENTGFGLGAWSLQQEIGNLTVTGGHIYDQIGSGILFRAYEDRGLLIDNALVGIRLKYNFGDHLSMRAYTGQQKFLFSRYQPIMKAIAFEGDFSASDKVHFLPGIGLLNRTLDRGSMSDVVANITAQDSNQIFVPRYNTYAATLYNTLSAGDFTWYVEGAYKTHEAILKDGVLQDEAGNVFFSTLSYAVKGLALNVSAKRTENFVMRTSPNEVLLRGMLNWQPVVARLRPQRLLARYMPASQDISEIAYGGDVLINPGENWDIKLNGTYINTLEGLKLYREAYADFQYRGFNNVTLSGGLQYLQYNQEKYQVKPGAPLVVAITPFAEIIYRLNKTNSVRMEVEYMHTEQDFGSWLFALLEYTIAPHWSFAISDMYTTSLNPNNPVGLKEPKHFYNLFLAYTTGPHRLTAQYVKQVEGINCTGGVCRYEPAFSGFKLGFTTTF